MPISPAALAITTIPEHSELDSQKVKGNHLADISAKYAALQRSKSHTSVMVQRNSPPDDNVEKLTRDTQQSAPETKDNIGSQMVVGRIRRETSGLDQIRSRSYQTKFPLLTVVHALNH